MKILLTIPHECLDEARGKNLYESYFYENIFKKILVVIAIAIMALSTGQIESSTGQIESD